MAGLSNRLLAGIMLALVICSILVYSGTDDHELLNWDDRSYVTNNPWVTNPNPSNLIDMFTGSRMANWHPLTWLSYVPEYALCADNASCYKFSNAVLHGLNGFLVAILVMLVVLKLGIQPAPVLEKSKRWPTMTSVTLAGVAAALLFVVHPQHVESVTWIAERKDLLCALFYFAALIAYLTASRSTYLKTYGWSFLFFVLALMSKSMAVSLPLSLMLFDVCLRRQQVTEQGVAGAIKFLFIEKLPFILIMLIAMAVTLATQSASEYAPVGFVGRLTFFVAGIEHYAISFLLPIGLSPFYPAAIAGINGLGVLTLLLFGSLLAWSLFRLANSRIAQAVSLVLLFFCLAWRQSVASCQLASMHLQIDTATFLWWVFTEWQAISGRAGSKACQEIRCLCWLCLSAAPYWRCNQHAISRSGGMIWISGQRLWKDFLPRRQCQLTIWLTRKRSLAIMSGLSVPTADPSRCSQARPCHTLILPGSMTSPINRSKHWLC
jgi:hypothetical protein